MSYTIRRPAPIVRTLGGLAEDTRAAMTAAPDYWIAWYTVKSIGLVAAIAYIAYSAGKNSRGGR